MDLQEKYITGIYKASYELDANDETIIEDKHEAYIGKRSLIIDKHDPGLFIATEFDWGSHSRGTKQLAVSILLEVGSSGDASRFMDTLVTECLSLIPSKSCWKLQIWKIREWLKAKRTYPDEASDLMLWCVIEEKPYTHPSLREQPKPVETKPPLERPPLIIPIPPLQSGVNSTGGPRMETIKRRHEKYPFNSLEVGKYFYRINPTEQERKKIGCAASISGKKNDKKYLCRHVTAEWARAHGIEVAQDSATVYICMRMA